MMRWFGTAAALLLVGSALFSLWTGQIGLTEFLLSTILASQFIILMYLQDIRGQRCNYNPTTWVKQQEDIKR